MLLVVKLGGCCRPCASLLPLGPGVLALGNPSTLRTKENGEKS